MKLDAVLFTNNLKSDLFELEELTKWELPIFYQKKYDYKEEHMSMLKELMEPEYRLIEKLKNEQKKY